MPEFIKEPLLARLRDKGIHLTFSRLRLRWNEGVVAEQVQFGRPAEPTKPRLTAKEVQVRLNAAALARFRLQIDSLQLRDGKLVLPVSGPDTRLALATNSLQNSLEAALAPISSRILEVEDVHTELRFLSGDEWSLDKLSAVFAGTQIHLSGTVTNASQIGRWRSTKAGPSDVPSARWPDRIRRFADVLERIRFEGQPDLRLDVQGDATDLQSFSVRLLINTPGAHTPWGDFGQGQLSARAYPAEADGLLKVEAALNAVHARTPWALVTNLEAGLRLLTIPGQSNLVSGHLDFSAAGAHTRWAGGTNLVISADWVHAVTNPIPLSGRTELRCGFAEGQNTSAADLLFAADFTQVAADPAHPPLRPEPAWGWWTNVAPFRLGWSVKATQGRAHQIEISDLASSGSWGAPTLVVTNLDFTAGHGTFRAEAELDIKTRRCVGRLANDCDPRILRPLLGPEAEDLISQFTWEAAPELIADLGITLPAWTNASPDWRNEVQPSVSLSGEFRLPRSASYKGLQISGARSHFLYSNLTWYLPDLQVSRPEGRISASHRMDERTKDFYWRLQSTVDPTAVRPLLGRKEGRVFDLITLSGPPAVSAEVWGRYQDPERTGFRATVTVTNFSFRGQSADHLQASLQYSNKLLQVFSPAVCRGTQHLSADGLAADFVLERIYLTNGIGRADPMWITRAIGPQVARAVSNYQFSLPPAARVYGTIPMRGEAGADLHFEVEGGPFRWWKFTVPHIRGKVHWQDYTVTLRDMDVAFYDGNATGLANFDFTRRDGTDLQFSVAFTNALLHDLMTDLVPRTNSLEGRVSGALVVSTGNSEDWHSVNGYGGLALRNGLIWDIPMFGIFSPVLNGIAPGLGNIRVTSGDCTFTITNGVVHSHDLEARSPAFRLQYRGDVDLEGSVNARVEAELLRDMWVVGPLLSTVLWPVTKMFEYKVTGAIGAPKTEPVYVVPKVILLPFKTLRSLKGLLPDEEPIRKIENPPATSR